jgi:ribosomal 30S subunit maturation factor RimM
MDYYKVGTIVNTQGLQGEVRIISVTDFSDERYQRMLSWLCLTRLTSLSEPKSQNTRKQKF